MKVLLLSLAILFTNCDSKRPVNVPKIDDSQGIEVKVRNLGLKIQKIDEEKVSKKLSQKEASNFHQRLQELVANYNKTSSLIKRQYKEGEKDKLQLEYIKTKAIWDYVVFNYPI